MASYSWTVNNNGYWSTSADWSPSGPPGYGASVKISTASFQTITLNDGTYSIGGLTLGDDELRIAGGGALYDKGSFTNTGTVFVQSGVLALNGGGSASAAGIVVGTDGTLAIGESGTLQLDSGTLVNAGQVTLNRATLVEDGTLTLT